MVNNKLELLWVGKNNGQELEPRILIKDEEKSYGEKDSGNLLIHGDNLLALKALEKDYAGRIKCIYIDPPYNTGSAFEHYNDNLEHSIWLDLMYKRLVILKRLLSENGIIFIQIDDNEMAYLKVICDEVFGRSNYLNTISVKMKNIAGASGGGEDKRLKKNVEYIICYTNNYQKFKWLRNAYSQTEIYDLVQKYKQEGISWKYTSVLYNPGKEEYICSTVDGDGNEIKIYNRINYEFKSISQISKEEGISEKEVYYKYMKYIHTTAMPQSSIRPRVMEELNNIEHNDLISIKYVPKTGKNKGKEYEQFYKGDKFRLLTWLNDVCEFKDGIWYKKDLQGTLWDGINLNNLTKEGNVVFPNGKKPEALLERILMMCTDENDYVLDSFLGSGTTIAVAHKMNRKWIGIEMGNHINTHVIPRLKSIIDNNDSYGVYNYDKTDYLNGFNYYELAPTLIKTDMFEQEIINSKYDEKMLSEAVALHEGFDYEPSQECYWKQSKGNEKSYLYVTTNFVGEATLNNIKSELNDDEYLIIACTSYDENIENKYKNIKIKKIPEMLLSQCEYGVDNYALNVVEEEEDYEDE